MEEANWCTATLQFEWTVEDSRWHELLEALERRKIICSVWAVPARKGCEGAEVVCAVDEDGAVAVAEDLTLVGSGQPAAGLGSSLGSELQAVSVGLGWKTLPGKRPSNEPPTFSGAAVLVSGKFDFDFYNTAAVLGSELQVWQTPDLIVAQASLKGTVHAPYICKISRPAVLMVRDGDRRSLIVRPEFTRGPFHQVGCRNLDWTWAQATLPAQDAVGTEVDKLRKLTARRGMAPEELHADGMPADKAEQYLEILSLPQGRGALHAMGALLAAPLAAAELVEQPDSAATLDSPGPFNCSARGMLWGCACMSRAVSATWVPGCGNTRGGRC
jgi:hypothetical protein